MYLVNHLTIPLIMKVKCLLLHSNSITHTYTSCNGTVGLYILVFVMLLCFTLHYMLYNCMLQSPDMCTQCMNMIIRCVHVCVYYRYF